MAPEVEVALGRKLSLTALLLAFWAVAYYGVALTRDPGQARALRTPLDDAIPFLPETIWIYCCVYTAMLLPLFTVRCWRVFQRVALAYTIVIGLSALVFTFFPVTSLGFRPDVSGLDESRFHLWGLKLNFFLDPPVNLFPSLHLSIATLAALSSGKVRGVYGVAALALTAAIAVSVLTLKQHFWVDAVAGFALGGAAYAACVRGFPAHPTDAAHGWAGPLAFVAFHASALGFLVALWAAGFRPWAS
jgi:hypothetical protein